MERRCTLKTTCALCTEDKMLLTLTVAAVKELIPVNQLRALSLSHPLSLAGYRKCGYRSQTVDIATAIGLTPSVFTQHKQDPTSRRS